MTIVKAYYEFKGLDFEPDLVKLYTYVRAKMAELYDKNEKPIEGGNIYEDFVITNVKVKHIITCAFLTMVFIYKSWCINILQLVFLILALVEIFSFLRRVEVFM